MIDIDSTILVKPDAQGKFPTPLDGALFMASLGIPQTPLRAGTKVAFLPEFQKLATTDPAQIRAWANSHPNCNFGSVGREGEFFTFEADSTDVRKRFEATGQKFTAKLIVASRPDNSRGHRWYRHAPGVKNVSQTYTKRQDFSVRAGNQYCVSPGSIHPDTGEQYRLLATDAPEVPTTAEIAFWESERAEKSESGKQEVPRNERGKVPHGAIHGFLLHHAGVFRNKGLTQDEIETVLLRMTHEQCEEPIDDDKVRQMARSICIYEAGEDKSLALNQRAASAVPAEWPDLKPCAGELKPVQSFNPEWLPDVVRPFVADISERMAVAVDFSAICALTCLAGAVNHRAFVYPLAMDKDFAEPLCISGAVIADSGKKKTPTWKILMKPLTEWEFDQNSQYQQRMAEYGKELDKFQRLKKDIDDYNREEKKAAKKEKRDPEFKPYDLPAAPKEPEKPRRLVMNDSTPEQVHEVAKTNPQGLFYYRDELSGWAAELDMIGREGSRSMFLQGMTGDHDHTVDRIGREGGHAKITLSVFGSFQPHLFVNFISEARNVADGTVPRFQFLTWPDDTKMSILDRPVNSVAKAQYRQVIRRLADMPDKSVEIHFGKEAQELFYKFQRDLSEKIRRETNPGKKSHLSKYEGGLAKMAALLQLVDTVAALPETPKLTSVSLETGEQTISTVLEAAKEIRVDLDHFQRALDLLAYLESHMHRVYDSKLEGVEYRKVRLLEHVKDGSIRDGMSANEILHKDWAGLGRKVTSSDAIEAALEELVELGWVRPTEPGPGPARPGRPTKSWDVNPAAREMEAV